MAGDRVGNRVQMRLHRGNGSGLEQVAACRKEDFPEKQDVSEKKNQRERNRGQKIFQNTRCNRIHTQLGSQWEGFPV